MGETTNQIEGEIAQKRSELSDNLIELKQRAKAAVDWRSQVEKRPGTMLAVAFGGGVVLSALFSALRGPARVYAERPSGDAVEYDRPTSKAEQAGHHDPKESRCSGRSVARRRGNPRDEYPGRNSAWIPKRI
jgi:hypothetical protein